VPNPVEDPKIRIRVRVEEAYVWIGGAVAAVYVSMDPSPQSTTTLSEGPNTRGSSIVRGVAIRGANIVNGIDNKSMIIGTL